MSVTVDQAGNPWVITANSGAVALPVTLWHPPFIPQRIRWVSPTASAGDAVKLTDSSATGDGGHGGVVCHFVANSSNFEVDESRPRGHELYPGLVLTQLDSGVLYLYI